MSAAPSSGDLWVCGDFSSISGDAKQRTFALLSPVDGLPRSLTSRPGWRVWSIASTADRVYVGGDGPGGHAAGYSANGTEQWTTQTDRGVQAVGLLAGVLDVGGHFDNVCEGETDGATTGFTCTASSATRHELLAIDAASGTVETWNPGAHSNLGVFALHVAGGRLQVGGEFTKIGRLQQGYGQFG